VCELGLTNSINSSSNITKFSENVAILDYLQRRPELTISEVPPSNAVYFAIDIEDITAYIRLD